MKPGDLRRFHDDAFHVTEKHLNGKAFMIIEATPDNEILSLGYATIFVDGTIDSDWICSVLKDHSETIDKVQ